MHCTVRMYVLDKREALAKRVEKMKMARLTSCSSSSGSDDGVAGALGALGGLMMMKKLLEDLEEGVGRRKAGIEQSRRFRVSDNR